MNEVLISVGILLFGLIVCLLLIFRAKRKARAIVHYEAMRDKLSLREEEEKVSEKVSEGLGNFNLGNIIGGFIVILIGTSLFPTIVDEVNGACSLQAVANVTTTSLQSCNTIISLVPIFFIASITLMAIGIMSKNLRNAGLI